APYNTNKVAKEEGRFFTTISELYFLKGTQIQMKERSQLTTKRFFQNYVQI
ncbi:unnamed protein product, partial [Urochloa humidicola]